MTFDQILTASAALHDHLCPRQVLGARIGVLAGRILALDLPREDKRLLTIVESDGCAVDGISAATGCRIGKRTLRVEDYGKVAATFVDTLTERSIRIAPHPRARETAAIYAPEATDRWHAQLLGYQRMPDEKLLVWRAVVLTATVSSIVSQPGRRAICQRCEEEISNEREVYLGSTLLCRACAGPAYYRSLPDSGLPDGKRLSQSSDNLDPAHLH